MPAVAPVSLLFNKCKHCTSLINVTSNDSSEIKYCEIIIMKLDILFSRSIFYFVDNNVIWKKK